MRTEVYDKFGRYLDLFLHQRFGTKKRAAEHYKLSPAFLSHISKGRKSVPPELKKSLLNDGFSPEFFAELEGIKDIEAVNTFDEMKFLYFSLKKVCDNQREIIVFYQKEFGKLQGK
jgi:hypothetical protein